MVPLRYLLFGLLLFKGNAALRNSCFNDPSNETLDDLPQDQFIAKLTDPSCYDKYQIPFDETFSSTSSQLLNVQVRINLTHLEVSQSQLTAYMLTQFNYHDERLNYKAKSPKRTIVVGEESLKSVIWTPNVLFKDQIDTIVKGIQHQDVFISIKPDGNVTYVYKMIVTFYCSLDLKKFPFDTQQCSLKLSDWSYDNASLSWIISDNRLNYDNNFHFSEYILDNATVATIVTDDGPYGKDEDAVMDYNELTITLNFHRDIGYYLFDFFLPSYLLVCTAWVTFWLQADAGPPRATLGASTVIAFVTLHLGVAKDIPKVSYTKASDIWFLGISCFIFFSLAEFAFVNVIWRRKKPVELKKRNNKHILKGAVMPSVARNHLRKLESEPNLWTPSPENLNSANNTLSEPDNHFNGNYRSNLDLVSNGAPNSNGHSAISLPEEAIHASTWETMTPREVAIWVDRKARIVFPLVFLLFNVLYWSFVYLL